MGLDNGSQVAGPAPMVPGKAQPKKARLVPFPMGLPPVEGATGVGCTVSWVVAKGWDSEAGSRDVECSSQVRPLDVQGRRLSSYARQQSPNYI